MENKIFFLPGDLVTTRQEMPNAPVMLVVRKVKRTVTIAKSKNTIFQGILCRWFATDLKIQEAIFNTKDLKKVE